ncbi:MAG: CBS domain-containing protein [Verrucomicrobia bacterium]|nr:CBS domain-containing protein [Verrucomicrobiota bacterium]
MTKDVLTVSEDTPIYVAMQLLVADHVTGLPVVDREGTLVGIVTEKDMLTLLNNDRIGHVTAGDLMTRDVVSFLESDDLAEINKCLKEKSFRRVPILSDGKLVGIVSRSDIMKAILRERRG